MGFRVYKSLRGARIPSPLVLCLGNFDGVHRGHRKVFDRVIRAARERSAKAAVVTFEPHPARLLRPARAPQLLTTLSQKLALFRQAGLDAAFVLRFNRALARLTPSQFAERVLAGRLGGEAVFVGSNFRFGRGQAGTPEGLVELGGRYGFEVGVIAPVVAGGAPISSTRIRGLVMAGQVEAAARLLGRPYSLSGKRVSGSGRGARLGFGTLNCQPEQECLPERGVYVTETRLGRRVVPSVTNIGVRPTFGGSRLLVETHLLRGGARARPARFEVVLLRRLRGEKKFAGPGALARQIGRDVAAARRYFASHPSRSG